MQHRLIRLTAGLAMGLSIASLLGCAGLNRLQAEVSTHPQWPAGVPTGSPTYHWERLPSMRSGSAAAEQAALESTAQAVLAQAGWRLDPAQPQWSVQIQGQTQRAPTPPTHPFNLGVGIGIGLGHGHIQLGSTWPVAPTPKEQAQVAVLIRPNAPGPIAYETRATADVWGRPSADQWRALVQAALREFPLDTVQDRTVSIDLAPKDTQTP